MYEWLKAFHIIAVISWMAGLLYLPRLFVYHSEDPNNQTKSETFKVMERRLLKAIMTPAMIASWLFGLGLALYPGYDNWEQPWFWAKCLCLIGLVWVHFVLAGHVKRFALDRNKRSSKHFRILNEVPTVLMIAIVIFAIVKPF